LTINADVAADGHVARRLKMHRLLRTDCPLANWTMGWLSAFAIGAVLGISLITEVKAMRPGDPVTVARLCSGIIFLLILSYAACYPIYRLLILSYAACYRIYRGLPLLSQTVSQTRARPHPGTADWGVAPATGLGFLWRLVELGAWSKPNAVARYFWRVCSIAAVPLVAWPLYVSVSQRPGPAKAQADTRAIASAIRMYVAHCGGLPADSSRTDCPVVAEPGGPYVVPRSLLLPQTSALGHMGGPFLNSIPNLPAKWTGAGRSYAYHIFPGGKFLICAQGEGITANSRGDWSCP
jgi:hypothetical protein